MEDFLGKKLFEMEPVVEFDDEGLPVMLTRMTFTLDELALIRTGLGLGADWMIMDGWPRDEVASMHDAEDAFMEAEDWTRGAKDCE